MTQFGHETLSDPQRFAAVGDYEAFVAEDWLHPRGSDNAQAHVRGKLSEEAREAAEALRSGDPARIVDEVGDFLWTATANGLNVGLALEDSLRRELGANQVGEAQIAISDIDKLALGLIPDEPVDAMAGWIIYLGYYLGKAAKQWRILGPLIDQESEPQTFADTWILLKRDRTRDGLTQALLVASAVTQRFAGRTLTDVFEHNARKLDGRKRRGDAITTRPK